MGLSDPLKSTGSLSAVYAVKGIIHSLKWQAAKGNS